MLDRGSRNHVFGMVNGVEVFNSRGLPEENAFSADLAKRFHLPGTGASDAHKLEDIGTYATEFERRVTCLDDLITELRAGRFKPAILDKKRDVVPPPRPYSIAPAHSHPHALADAAS